MPFDAEHNTPVVEAQAASVGPSAGRDKHVLNGSTGNTHAGVPDTDDAGLLQPGRAHDPAFRLSDAERAAIVAANRKRGLLGDGEVGFTLVTNTLPQKRLTKAFRASEGGDKFIKGQAPTTGIGLLQRVVLPREKPMSALARLLEGFAPNEALTAGEMPGAALVRRMLPRPIVEKLTDAERGPPGGDGPLWRGECLQYRPVEPGLLHIDHDLKDLPAELRQRIKQMGWLPGFLERVDPQWQTNARLIRPSVSSGVRDKRTNHAMPKGGVHCYAMVKDGGDLARYVKVLADRAVLLGLGYVVVSAGGSLLERSPIDLSASGTPYWLAFEADAVLEPGGHLEHVPGARKPVVREGPMLDTRALPDLSQDERDKVAAIWRELKAEKQAEARAIRLARGAKPIERLIRAGVPRPEAERRVLDRFELGRLPLEDTFYFDHPLPSGGCTAAGHELLASADTWFPAGTTRNGADPREPSYPNDPTSGLVTRNKAAWKADDYGRGLHINSRAHGGQQFSLAYDAENIVEIVAGLTGSAWDRLVHLRGVFDRLYLPADPDLARRVLHEAGIPTPAVMEFGGVDDLSRDKLVAAIRDEDWDKLAGLRALFGRFFELALADLREEDELVGIGGAAIGWDELAAKLDATEAASDARVDAGLLDEMAKSRMAALAARTWTEDALTQAFREAHGEHLRFDHNRGCWFVLDAGRWRSDMPWSAFRWVRDLARSCAAAAAKPSGDLFKVKTARAVEFAVRFDAPFAVGWDAWDRDPMLLGVPGGVIDLRTSQWLPPDARHLITRQTLVTPAAPGTPTPVWDAFLGQAMSGDTGLIAFVHFWFGYCLSGATTWESFVFGHGSGGNGKGVMDGTIARIFGSYAMRANMEVFMQTKHPDHPQEVARMAGARLVTASEVGDGSVFNLARLKEHTGGEHRLSARFMRQNAFDFTPTHKLTFYGNHRPGVAHVDDAIRRRLKLLPFLHRPPVPDETLKSRLEPEYPGILRKLIDHGVQVHAALAAGGHQVDRLVPDAVRAASDEYLEDQDVLRAWVRDRVRVVAGGEVGTTAAFEDHQSWAFGEGRAPFPFRRKFSKAVVTAVNDPCCTARHTDKGTVIMGIRLLPSEAGHV